MSYICEDCPRKCKIDREKQTGFCLVGNKIVVAKVIENFMWEEPSLCFKKGVTAIFFAGCNLKCEFCQNSKISRCGKGKEYSPEEFAKWLEEIDKSETDGLDFISPTQFSTLILKALEIYKPKHKIIWNSNGYENAVIVEKLSTFVSVFLPDFKYVDDSLALKISKCADYKNAVIKAIKVMSDLKPNKFNGEEMTQGVIVRHLILPNEIKNSLGVLDEINKSFPQVYVSLMSQFTSNGEGEYQRTISPLEYKIVINHFKKLGLKNGYIQELTSSSDDYIPKF